MKFCPAKTLEQVHCRNAHNAKSVGDASSEINRGSFFKIFSWASHFGDMEPCVDNLGEHFIIENEVVRIGFKVDSFKYPAIKSAISGMVFGQFIAHHQVLGKGEKSVGDILI